MLFVGGCVGWVVWVGWDWIGGLPSCGFTYIHIPLCKLCDCWVGVLGMCCGYGFALCSGVVLLVVVLVGVFGWVEIAVLVCGWSVLVQ